MEVKFKSNELRTAHAVTSKSQSNSWGMLSMFSFWTPLNKWFCFIDPISTSPCYCHLSNEFKIILSAEGQIKITITMKVHPGNNIEGPGSLVLHKPNVRGNTATRHEVAHFPTSQEEHICPHYAGSHYRGETLLTSFHSFPCAKRG